MLDRTNVWLGVVVLLLMACGEEPVSSLRDAGTNVPPTDAGTRDAGPEVDPTEALFRPDHVLEIVITLAPSDWAVLREQPDTIGSGRTTCAAPPTEEAYTYFPGEVTVDGVTVSNVGVRKKGGFGSISSTRPGLKIKAHEYVAGQHISGLKRLTLNNNVQDPTLISQCVGYDLFRQAGVPASRCSFAHVTVNGEDLGIYSNVETIKKPFLRRHFADDEGRLYESGGDFVPGGTLGYQPKTDAEAPDCSDLLRVVDAVDAPSATFAESLDAVVDVDAFTTYWAMEVITDHWDGYANNRNNHFFYHDPTSDKLHFIPWGIDALFTGRERTTRPQSVFACGRLPWRMYDEPSTRDLYIARLRELLDTVWREDAILAEISRMQALLEPLADPQGTGELAASIAGTRAFVSRRKVQLLAELDAGTPVWPFASGDESCRIFIGDIGATFETTWDSIGTFRGSGTMTGTVAGFGFTTQTVYGSAGISDDSQAVIQLIGQLDDGRFAVVFIILNNEDVLRPGTAALDFVNVAAFMTFYDPRTETSSGGGLMLGGAVTFSAASMTSGAPIVGSINGRVLEF